MFELYEFGNCGRTSRFPIHFNESGVEAVGRRKLGYGILTVEREVQSIAKVNITILDISENCWHVFSMPLNIIFADNCHN